MIDFITEDTVAEIINKNPGLFKSWVAEAFQHHHAGTIIQPQKTYLQISDNLYDRAIALPAYAHGTDGVAGIKWIGSHSGNVSKGLERASALIILNDPATMHPIAVLEGSLISSMRTFAVSMLMMDKFMADQKDFTVGIIGMGRLGNLHARFLGDLYNQVGTVVCYSKTAPFDAALNYPKVEQAKGLDELLKRSDVIVTATNATSPYISHDNIAAKTRLIINLSLMDFALDAMTKSSHIIVDDWEQNIKAKKVFKDGVDAKLITRDQVEEIGAVLFGEEKARTGRIFINPLGMGIEDIVVAKKIHGIVMEPSPKPYPPMDRPHKPDGHHREPS